MERRAHPCELEWQVPADGQTPKFEQLPVDLASRAEVAATSGQRSRAYCLRLQLGDVPFEVPVPSGKQAIIRRKTSEYFPQGDAAAWELEKIRPKAAPQAFRA